MYTNCDKEIRQFTQSGVEKIKDEQKSSGLVATMNMESKNTEITKNITIKYMYGHTWFYASLFS